ncbi:MAG: excinuclease ABC subunit C [Candidatus Omnitrophica bacterium CG02_land_8_20_14_3_00__42_8]|nr:MAG: excinuclease ABC subunit C [Candidatus Omnitrophica bacterium CG02_land_8_20_14_3_00__42_8]
MRYLVYILRSKKDSKRHYIGIAQDLKKRLNEHNDSKSEYTKKFAPWEIETFITFKDKLLAKKFERYLKSGSGYAFLNRHFI